MDASPKLEKIDRARLAWSIASMPVFIAVFMFLPAGTWHWRRGWLFILVFGVLMLVACAVLWRCNPEIFTARTNAHEGTKPWDKRLLGYFFAAFAAIFVVAALDDGRFHWFPLPGWASAAGYVLLALGVALITWAEAVNKFFEPTVRLQTDRGQHVIDRGPYAYIRHPGYLSWLPMSAGIAIGLGSLWALIPAAISCGLFILRAHWEDQMLHAELPGYKEYAERVRYKMLPGFW